MPLILFLKMYFFNCNSRLNHVVILSFKIPFVLCGISTSFLIFILRKMMVIN